MEVEASLLQLLVDMLHMCEEPLLDVILMVTLDQITTLKGGFPLFLL